MKTVLRIDKVTEKELYIFRKGSLSGNVKSGLSDFYRSYQLRSLVYFAEAKLRFESEFPGIVYPGAFAEFDSITGKMRPLEEQRAWSWGDCRALGIWSYLLLKGTVPSAECGICTRKELNLKSFYYDYCRFIYEKLLERYIACDGHFPFLVDIRTNTASNDPRNHPFRNGYFDASHVFASSGFMEYGLLSGNREALELGRKILGETIECGMNFRGLDQKTGAPLSEHCEGFIMVTLGAIVDTLKCLGLPGAAKNIPDGFEERLLEDGVKIAEFILKNYSDPETGEFWEFNSPKTGQPFVNSNGKLICDPGHSVEACGFIAELSGILKKKGLFPDKCNFFIKSILKIIEFMDANAYSSKGVMFKNYDLIGRCGIADVISSDKREFRTAPWWNIRECTAAALKIHELTRKAEILEVYRRAQNGSLLNYPNRNIGWMMVQTLDADTLEPLPFHPATGNIDAMHTSRTVEREIESLELL